MPSRGRIALTVTTAAAFHQRPARMFTRMLTRRLPLRQGAAEIVETAVHEAVINAIVHGNLEMSWLPRGCPESVHAFWQTAEARARESRYAPLPVSISADWNLHDLVVSVRDRGLGNAPCCRLPERDTETGIPAGRGLGIMRMLCDELAVSEGGRCVTMTFAR